VTWGGLAFITGLTSHQFRDEILHKMLHCRSLQKQQRDNELVISSVFYRDGVGAVGAADGAIWP
jgi:hypothetical protein